MPEGWNLIRLLQYWVWAEAFCLLLYHKMGLFETAGKLYKLFQIQNFSFIMHSIKVYTLNEVRYETIFRFKLPHHLMLTARIKGWQKCQKGGGVYFGGVGGHQRTRYTAHLAMNKTWQGQNSPFKYITKSYLNQRRRKAQNTKEYSVAKSGIFGSGWRWELTPSVEGRVAWI